MILSYIIGMCLLGYLMTRLALPPSPLGNDVMGFESMLEAGRQLAIFTAWLLVMLGAMVVYMLLERGGV